MSIATVIGGSSGIGSAICEKLKDEYTVINMSRTENKNTNNIYCDVSDYDSVVNGFKQLVNIYGIPSILVYSAGFVEVQSIQEIDYETLMKTYQVNIIGAFLCTQQYVKYIDKFKDNKIIYIASTAGQRASPGWSCYSSSKSALINLSLTMSEELKSYGIKTYCISPGRCATEVRRKLAPNEDQSKIMSPSELSQVVYTLIKDDGLLCNNNIIVKKDVYL